MRMNILFSFFFPLNKIEFVIIILRLDDMKCKVRMIICCHFNVK